MRPKCITKAATQRMTKASIRSFKPTGLRKRLSPGNASCMMTTARLLPRLGRIRVLLNAVIYPLSQLRGSLFSVLQANPEKAQLQKARARGEQRIRIVEDLRARVVGTKAVRERPSPSLALRPNPSL